MMDVVLKEFKSMVKGVNSEANYRAQVCLSLRDFGIDWDQTV
jgi:hypothetical protein